MGGHNSGLRGGNPVVEDGLILDIGVCLARGELRPGFQTSGRFRWRDSYSGECNSSVRFDADMRELDGARLRLRFVIVGRDGDVRRHDQWIALITSRPHFGGVRWWFRCPTSGRRVRALHLPPFRSSFASRQAHGLGYCCQRESRRGRLLRAARSLDAKLGGNGNLVGPAPSKPKWMRWQTYWDLCEQLDRAAWRAFANMGLPVIAPGPRQPLDADVSSGSIVGQRKAPKFDKQIPKVKERSVLRRPA